MYAPVATTEAPSAEPPTSKGGGGLSPATQRVLWNIALVAALTGALLVTYDRCITCVLAITILSLLLLNCVYGMPLVFVLSLGVLLFHAIDYQRATIKVEVPLGDIVYSPTLDDVERYVHVIQPPAGAPAAALPQQTPPPPRSAGGGTVLVHRA